MDYERQAIDDISVDLERAGIFRTRSEIREAVHGALGQYGEVANLGAIVSWGPDWEHFRSLAIGILRVSDDGPDGLTDDRPVHYALCGFHYGGQDAFCDRLTQNTSGFCDEHEAEIKQYRD